MYQGGELWTQYEVNLGGLVDVVVIEMYTTGVMLFAVYVWLRGMHVGVCRLQQHYC